MRPYWLLYLVILIPDSFQQNLTDAFDFVEGDQVDPRILNRKPHKIPTKDQKDQSFLYRSPCFEVACPVDDSYPMDLVVSTVAKYQQLVEQLHSMLYLHPAENLILMENITDAYRLKGNFACESDVVWVRVGWAHDITGRILLVVNTPRFPQIHRLETCRYGGKSCEFLPPCYKSRCQQRYSHRHLIVIDPSQLGGRPYIDLFPLPSSCSCFVENFVYF